MSNWVIYGIGFIAQILFSARLLFQWITSEKHKKVITPFLFWYLSLLASFILFIYGYLRDDFAIMLGQVITYFIYIRNIQLQRRWSYLPGLIRSVVVVFPFAICIYYLFTNSIEWNSWFKNELIPFWLLTLGIISQLIFTMRFVVQWLQSEKQQQSILPFGFWVLSLIGSVLILIYAIFRKDPVLFLGHLLGSAIYIRNIMLLKHGTKVMQNQEEVFF